ncbi:unnamed protein product [Paramecium pentaurelia]|uniref:Uncharacterized protein n=1 Tax=Paramecium pentaurelia TaxID=43138 RepID=A0A8S1TRD3_9CILI|nr:unnamed protein product [Paramecium pentaurelia]
MLFMQILQSQKKQNSGVSICLLCKDIFCNESCSLSIRDLLNYHVEKRHHGNSIFLSLQDGSVTLISQSTSIKKFKYLYYNNLGEKINLENLNSDWNQYILDITKDKELVDIIVNNKYRKIIKSQQKGKAIFFEHEQFLRLDYFIRQYFNQLSNYYSQYNFSHQLLYCLEALVSTKVIYQVTSSCTYSDVYSCQALFTVL